MATPKKQKRLEIIENSDIGKQAQKAKDVKTFEGFSVELHEYQVKSLLYRYKILSPPYWVVSAGDPIDAFVSALDPGSFFVRPQVHGNGQVGFFAASAAEVGQGLRATLGSSVQTCLSGQKKFRVARAIVVPAVAAVRTFTLSVAYHRSTCPLVTLSEGEKARSELAGGAALHPFQLRKLGFGLKLPPPLVEALSAVIQKALLMFYERDALFLELSPLALTEAGLFYVLKARMTVDDAALFRQPELRAMADVSQVGPKAAVPPHICEDLQGDIGILANGKGLALATLDLVTLHGGKAGPVVDVGSAIVADRLSRGIKVLQQNKTVGRLFLNLFTGIEDAALAAKVIIREKGALPMVIRLEGTNGAAGRRLLERLGGGCSASESLEITAKDVVRGN